MSDTTQSDSRLTRPQRRVVVLLAVVCIVAVPVGLTAAQNGTDSRTLFYDGFGGDLSNYTVESTGDDGSVTITNNTFLDGQELQLETPSTGTTRVSSIDTVNLTADNVTASADFRIGTDENAGDPQRIEAEPIWLDHPNASGQSSGFQVQIHHNDGAQILSSYTDTATIAPSSDVPGLVDGPAVRDLSVSMSIDFENEEVNAILRNESTGDVVGEATAPFTSDPLRTGYHVKHEADQGGINDENMQLWVDNVEVTEARPGSISVDINNFQRPGTEQRYTIEFDDGSGSTSDVSKQSNVTSSHPDVLTVNESRRVLNATSNRSALPQEVTISAEYDGYTDSKNVTVAKPTVENLDLLPTWWQVNATVGDGMMLWLIGATLFAIVATRIANSFAGIGAYTMLITAGWVSGPVSDGVLVATLLTGIFLGMNLALNIDTTIQR